MAHAPVPQAQNNGPSSIYDLLFRLIKRTPTWVRVVVVLLLAGGVALSLAGKVLDVFGKGKEVKPPTAPSVSAQTVPISIQIQNGPYAAPDGSKQISPPGNANNSPQNLDATRHVDEDAEHYKFHLSHTEDSPPLAMISRSDAQNDVGYKFYKKTDKCVLIVRHKDGVPISQFIKDPGYRNGVPVPQITGDARPQHRERDSTSVSLFDALIPTAAAAELEFPALAAKMENVQAGCVNPHAGPFSWWWGQGADPCWSPMYRQWRDGCTHYQMFNRCANAWDGRIFWVNCNPNHYY